VTNYPLSPDQVDAYQRDGYLFPLDVFDRQQVSGILADLEQARSDAKAKGVESEIAQLLRANAQLRRSQVLRPWCCSF